MEIRHNVEEVVSDLPEHVILVAAVKYASNDQILELIKSGIKNFGFNTYQQLKEVKDILPINSRIHFIGHLQSNKVRKVLEADPFLIQSVDSYKLTEIINDHASKLGIHQDILLQVKTDEHKQFGISLSELIVVASRIEKYLGNVRVLGLMTIPPFSENPKTTIACFKSMKQHYDSLSQELGRELGYLSMGMSHDYRAAVREGANMVRIGRALFE
jgi:PLP dependent protein